MAEEGEFLVNQAALVIGVGPLTRCILFPLSLVREDGARRHAPDRDTLVHGVSPYAYSPSMIEVNTPHRFEYLN
jgi:hypothetical protein